MLGVCFSPLVDSMSSSMGSLCPRTLAIRFEYAPDRQNLVDCFHFAILD